MEEYEQIGKAQKGDQSALAELLQAHYLFVFKYLVQLTLQRQLAEDLTQETMIRAIKHIKRYQATKSRFSSWLITIATRLYLDEKRKRQREQNYVTSADALSANASRLLQELGEKAHGFIRGMNRCFCLLQLIIRTDTIELWDKTIDVLKPRYP